MRHFYESPISSGRFLLYLRTPILVATFLYYSYDEDSYRAFPLSSSYLLFYRLSYYILHLQHFNLFLVAAWLPTFRITCSLPNQAAWCTTSLRILSRGTNCTTLNLDLAIPERPSTIRPGIFSSAQTTKRHALLVASLSPLASFVITPCDLHRLICQEQPCFTPNLLRRFTSTRAHTDACVDKRHKLLSI